jgi:hypothetical protein
MWTVGRDSAAGIATRCRLDGPGIEFLFGDRFSASLQMVPGAHAASFTMSTESFPGLKRQERGVIHLPLSSAEVEESVELIICFQYVPSW